VQAHTCANSYRSLYYLLQPFFQVILNYSINFPFYYPFNKHSRGPENPYESRQRDSWIISGFCPITFLSQDGVYKPIFAQKSRWENE
jgi:hypothetical protein